MIDKKLDIVNKPKSSVKKVEFNKPKPYKIKLGAGDKRAQGMYILLNPDEEKYTQKGLTAPPNRTYKIQIAVETIHNNERVRGKRVFNIAKGTSVIKAVESMIPKKNEMIKKLKENGTLKIQKIETVYASNKSTKIDDLFEKFINKKMINKKPNTVRVYKTNYKTHIQPYIGKLYLEDINEDLIQGKVINAAINKGKAPHTIKGIKRILKPLLEANNNVLNWTLIELPKAENGTRIYNKGLDTAKEIVNTLLNYKHKKANGVFKFLLTGRRLNEVLYLEHENINYDANTFTIPAKLSKANDDFTFLLTPTLIDAIKSQGTVYGRIFRIESRQMLEHFKIAMRTIGVYDMVLHDIRSMVAQIALDAGADIYQVSKMLAHKRVTTTEQSYAKGGANQAIKAQQKFEQILQVQAPTETINVEIMEDKFTQIKKFYPNIKDEILLKAIDFIENSTKRKIILTNSNAKISDENI